MEKSAEIFAELHDQSLFYRDQIGVENDDQLRAAVARATWVPPALVEKYFDFVADCEVDGKSPEQAEAEMEAQAQAAAEQGQMPAPPEQEQVDPPASAGLEATAHPGGRIRYKQKMK